MTPVIKRLLPLIIFLALGVLFYASLFREHQGELPSALLDQPFPAFQLPTVYASKPTVTVADITGEAALVNVWATWCPSCRIEHPYLLELAQQGVVIYGVNYKDDANAARQWLTQLHNPYRFSIRDDQGTLGIDLGVYGAPETYLIDHRGMIRYKHVGIVDEKVWTRELAPRYRKLLQTQRKEVSHESH